MEERERERMKWNGMKEQKKNAERKKQWRTRDIKRVHVPWCMWQMHMKYVLLWKFFVNRFGPPLPPLVVVDRVLSLRTICADVYKSYTYEYIQQRQLFACFIPSFHSYFSLACTSHLLACLPAHSLVRSFAHSIYLNTRFHRCHASFQQYEPLLFFYSTFLDIRSGVSFVVGNVSVYTRHIHSKRPKQIWIILLFNTQSYYFWMPNYYM